MFPQYSQHGTRQRKNFRATLLTIRLRCAVSSFVQIGQQKISCHIPPQSGPGICPVLFLQSSRNGGLKCFAPIPSSGELPCVGQQDRRYSHGVGYQISLHLLVLQNEVFYSGQSANPTTNLIEKVTQLQEDIRRHSWAPDMEGHWLTRSSSTF